MKEELEKIVTEFEELSKKLDGWCKYYGDESERPDQEPAGEAHDRLIRGTQLVADSWHTDMLMLQLSVLMANLQDRVLQK